ncbi:unnamed protein product [Blepharisma stoltei]|uniref:ARM repeat superfamily protein n=1 Tax=Blepharisma stoltei TaxID=1481888 RepID=A0AAU9J5D2_9CILI|nr:unnamed protein product [Blepharisma stoltei]
MNRQRQKDQEDILEYLGSEDLSKKIEGIEILNNVINKGNLEENIELLQSLTAIDDPESAPLSKFIDFQSIICSVIKHSSPEARENFIRMCGDILTNHQNKYDLEKWLIPYLIIGLFDNNETVRETTFEIIEEIGAIHERENNEIIRDPRGKGHKHSLSIPNPIIKRPRAGARYLFRKHFDKLYDRAVQEFSAWNLSSKIFSANILITLIVYTEDRMSQNIESFLNLSRLIIENNEKVEILEKIELGLKLLGRFLQIDTYLPIVLNSFNSIQQENCGCHINCFSSSARPQTWNGETALGILALLLEGHLETAIHQKKLDPQLETIITTLYNFSLSSMIGPQALNCLKTIDTLLAKVYENINDIKDFTVIIENSTAILWIVIHCESLSQSHSIVEMGNNCFETMNKILLKNVFLNCDKLIPFAACICEMLNGLLASSDIKNWNTEHKKWIHFKILVNKLNGLSFNENKETAEIILNIVQKTISYKGKHELHKECLGLIRNKAYDFSSTIDAIIVQCLSPKTKSHELISYMRQEAMLTLNSYKTHGFNSRLIWKLIKCFDDSQMTVKMQALDEISRIFSNASSFTRESIIFITYKKTQLFHYAVNKILSIYENQAGNIKAKALNCLLSIVSAIENPKEENFELQHNKKLKSLNSSFGKDLEFIVNKLSRSVVDQSDCREAAHKCILAVKMISKASLEKIAKEALERNDNKTWEYIDAVMNIP